MKELKEVENFLIKFSSDFMETYSQILFHSSMNVGNVLYVRFGDGRGMAFIELSAENVTSKEILTVFKSFLTQRFEHWKLHGSWSCW